MEWVILIIVVVVIVFAIINGVSSSNPETKKYMDKHRAMQNEAETYTDDLYDTYYSDNIILDIEDGKYDGCIMATYDRDHGEYPIKITKYGGNKIIGYLIEDRNLFKLIEAGEGYLQVPLFIFTSTVKGQKVKHGYVYVKKSTIERLRSKNIVLNEFDSDIDIDDILLDLEEYTENDDSIELPIRGINFRNLDQSKVGTFSGCIAPDRGNKFDKYAIGVYGEDGTHFGFIEKNQKNLYKLINAGEGCIDAVLEISTFIDEETGETRFHGIVTIDKEYLS